MRNPDIERSILVREDELGVRSHLQMMLAEKGYWVETAHSDDEVLMRLKQVDVSVSAIMLQTDVNHDGWATLREIRRINQHLPVIVISSACSPLHVVEAITNGATDFLTKPIIAEDVRRVIQNALEKPGAERPSGKRDEEVRACREKIACFCDSEEMLDVQILLAKIGPAELPVLIQGETGVGKEVMARELHARSARANKPFFKLNCAALPSELVESELFGYEKGAFTDAKARKEGMFEQAEGGTLLLDEIGELELSLQAKLLRVLEEGAFRRVGGLKDIPFDARIIAASNRDLKHESEGGRFRLDLYYRLSVIQIDIPSLRERGDDVLLLAEHYMESFGQRLRKKITGISPEVAKVFRQYDWPGNVRELRNVIERAMILEDEEVITMKYIPRALAGGVQTDMAAHDGHRSELFHLPPGGVSLDEVEMSLVRQAIERSGGNQTKAAEMLGISRDQLRYRLKKLEEHSVAAG